MSLTPAEEAAKRRTFAIISHPDAGKTTLTEKLLLYSGAIETAGSIRDRRRRRSTTSDWHEIEKRRGISISSTVLRFTYDDIEVNLLDTPGHRDFSEDTYRVLSAADTAVMVIDAAKGIEMQTLKLFQVTRQRGIPLITFVNKCDRPGPGPLGIIDEIEAEIGVRPTPATWPVGLGQDFYGIVDRRAGLVTEFARSEHGAKQAGERRMDDPKELLDKGEAGEAAYEELALLDEIEANVDSESFLAGESTPVFFGSALWNFGVRHLLEALVELAPSPSPRLDVEGIGRSLDAPCSGFVFKIQANMDRNHRDHIAFMRIASGEFERGVPLTAARTGKVINTKYAQQLFGQDRETIDEAFPGDIVGLVNASDLRIGDSVYSDEPVTFPPIPTFAPEYFMVARNKDTGRYKQFKRGLSQLDREGVVQVLRDPSRGDQAPVLAAVGPLQFEVAVERLENEFGASVEIRPVRYKAARQTDVESAPELRRLRGVDVLEKDDGGLFALFESNYVLNRTIDDHPELTLNTIVEL